MNTPNPVPDLGEYVIMTEMLAILSDTSKLGGCDTDAGMDALYAGARRLTNKHYSPMFVVTMALSGWLGAMEGLVASQGITMSEVISRYASALAQAEDEYRAEGSA